MGAAQADIEACSTGRQASEEADLASCARHLHKNPKKHISILPSFIRWELTHFFAALYTSSTWSTTITPQMLLLAVHTC
jgi:hypothetical protein